MRKLSIAFVLLLASTLFGQVAVPWATGVPPATINAIYKPINTHFVTGTRILAFDAQGGNATTNWIRYTLDDIRFIGATAYDVEYTVLYTAWIDSTGTPKVRCQRESEIFVTRRSNGAFFGRWYGSTVETFFETFAPMMSTNWADYLPGKTARERICHPVDENYIFHQFMTGAANNVPVWYLPTCPPQQGQEF